MLIHCSENVTGQDEARPNLRGFWFDRDSVYRDRGRRPRRPGHVSAGPAAGGGRQLLLI